MHVCTFAQSHTTLSVHHDDGSAIMESESWITYRNASQESQPGFLNIYRFRAIFCHTHYFTRHLALCRCQYLNSFQKAGVTLSDITRCLEHWTLDCLASLQPLSPHANLWLSDEQTGRHPYHFHPGEHVGTGSYTAHCIVLGGAAYCAVSLIPRLVIISILSQGFEKLLKILHKKSDRISLITPGRIYKTSSNHRGPIELRITTHMKTTSSFKLLGVRGCHIF